MNSKKYSNLYYRQAVKENIINGDGGSWFCRHDYIDTGCARLVGLFFGVREIHLCRNCGKKKLIKPGNL